MLLIERQYLFFYDYILIELILNDIRWYLPDDLLKCNVSLQALVEALLEEGLANRQTCNVQCSQLLVDSQGVGEGQQTTFVRNLFVLGDIKELYSIVLCKAFSKDLEPCIVETIPGEVYMVKRTVVLQEGSHHRQTVVRYYIATEGKLLQNGVRLHHFGEVRETFFFESI